LLIRRSDLDGMLEVTRSEPPSRGYQPRPRDPRYPLGMGLPQSLDQLSTADVHGRRVSPDEMQQIIEELHLADEVWEQAQATSENAPPDPGFPPACGLSPRRVSSRRAHLLGLAGLRDSPGLRSRTVAT
jgi:hypothetical protein